MAGDDKPAESGDAGRPDVTPAEAGAAGRNRGYRNRRGNKISGSVVVKQPLFEGRVEGLKGHIYDCSDHKQAELFTKTTKEISGYVGREFRTGGDDVRRAVDNLELPAINKPGKPGANADEYDKIEWAGKMKTWQARNSNLEEGMKRLYNVVYRQCSDIMLQKLKAMENFEEDIIGKSDALGLLKAIKQITFNFESQKFEPHAISDAMKQFYAFKQGQQTTTQSYLKEFTNNVDVVTYCGGSLGTALSFGNTLARGRGIDMTTLTPLQEQDNRAEARERYLVVVFLLVQYADF